ncbi:hypothetical protein [Bradyrhizobium sp. 150]|uniref:hypothetical protein n=1 Tax=Bradyrhizobium sp. 150 TaxID=2782625 RepID=UPI001FF8B3E6|nr:hypothetical protein [Bradyrhizobium sp. 150]
MAAARRPTTQATLPPADHAAEVARLQRENERLRMERDILKTTDRDLSWSSEMRFRFIEDRRADYPVTIVCDVLGVSPAAMPGARARRAVDLSPIVTSSTTSNGYTATQADAMAALGFMPS